MIRVAVIVSNPSARRGVLDELAVYSDSLDAFAVQPSDAPKEVLTSKADVLLLDVDAVFQIDAQAFSEAILKTHSRGFFVSCCSGCPTDRERIAAIEYAGADWCPLPAAGRDLAAFIHKVRGRPFRDEVTSFLSALWELVAEGESVREIQTPAQMEDRNRSARNAELGWAGMLTDILARTIKQRTGVFHVAPPPPTAMRRR